MTDRIKALEDALRKISELNETGADENGHRWVNSDLIEQEIVFALAASQSAQPVAVKVKPLVWKNFDAWSYWAKSVVGTYRVREINGVWRTTLDCDGVDQVQPIYEYMTDDLTPLDFEAAQLAAQADYEARIMAALDVQPLTVQDAARVVADGLNDGEVWRVAVNGAAAILNSGMPGSYWPPVKQIREALDAALRVIAEGRA